LPDACAGQASGRWAAVHPVGATLRAVCAPPVTLRTNRSGAWSRWRSSDDVEQVAMDPTGHAAAGRRWI